ncbi:PspC domain-containing protein [Myxococcus sp. RHSTA-1-4]|uniref:PspC domain-containing protein n=1 Tax=Myxococcus sp. RHSTA-1-4 TaxID=2874601 RepID=UPI001CC1433A|nr:PspC domain-containing protein [Myxococcus sp. RHSTA-1-4]MBZ4416312.1 PspC domain-containing protein [Myxococcus sp. RHSTA-1-4]
MDTKRCADCAEDMKLEARKCPRCGARTEPLHRDMEGKKLAGVCAALGRELGVDAALLRVGFVVALAVSGGTALMVYLLLWAFTPPSAVGRAPLQRAVDWLGSVGGSEEPRVERRV